MRTQLLVLSIAMTCAAGGAAAAAPPSVADLVGARGAGGETQLLARGFEQRESRVVGDQRFSFWWNSKRGECISVSTTDGRYASIEQVPGENCDAPSASRPSQSTAIARDPNSLVLVCYGAGTRPTVKTEQNYAWDDKEGKWRTKDSVHGSSEGFNSDVQIELYGDHGRIHLGQSLVPPINSGGDNGWWELNNLQVTPDQIMAGYRLNGMNKPRLTVDRRSGQIVIDGQTNFSGRCDIGNYGGGQRRF